MDPRDAGDAAGDAAGEWRDWSDLPADMLVRVLSILEVPDLLRSGAVCKSWNAGCISVRRLGLCSSELQSPCLVYSSDDPRTATLRRLSTGKVHQLPLFPDGAPLADDRYVVGSSHGWLVVADGQSELHLLNPATRAQVALPPLLTLATVRPLFKDGKGASFFGHAILQIFPSLQKPNFHRMTTYPAATTRHHLYMRAALSADPSQGSNCVVLLIHEPSGQLSFVRFGGAAWTWITVSDHCLTYSDCFYDEKEGLFYALRCSGELHTIDLSGEAPVVKIVLADPFEIAMDCIKYIVRAPWGDLLQVWRYFNLNGVEPTTNQVVVYSIDFENQELNPINSLKGNALFLGFGSYFASVGDFPMLSPNCIYLAHDRTKVRIDKIIDIKEVVVFNVEHDSFTDLLPQLSWMDTPPAAWIRLSYK